MTSLKTLLRTAVAGLAIAVAASALPAKADEQYFPLQSYRVGPYAAGGTGFFGGFIDYMNLINTRDGGVNGVKLTWDECETQYEVERGVECYERQKSRANAAAWNPLSVGIAYAMIDRISTDMGSMRASLPSRVRSATHSTPSALASGKRRFSRVAAS